MGWANWPQKQQTSLKLMVADPRRDIRLGVEWGETRWDDDGPGKALAQIDDAAWAMWGFGEMVHMTEELAGLLGLIEPEKEKRQCVTKVFAAGLRKGEFQRWMRWRSWRRTSGWSKPGWRWRPKG